MGIGTELTCEGCGKTIEIVPDEVPLYKKAIDAGWRLEYHPPVVAGDPPRISAKCEVCRTRSIHRPRWNERDENRREGIR